MRIYLLVEDTLDTYGHTLYVYKHKKNAEAKRDYLHKDRKRDDVMSYRVETHWVVDENDSQQQQENYS